MDGQKKEVNWKEKYEEIMAEKKTFEECYQGAVIRLQIEAKARASGMIYPDLIVKLVDLSKCQFDEESDVVIGAFEAVQQLIAEKPYLFAPKVRQGVAPPPKLEDGFLETVQRELGFKKS
jgi:hypothetical protein